eukprot:1190286-Rhodomonas_salina.1
MVRNTSSSLPHKPSPSVSFPPFRRTAKFVACTHTHPDKPTQSRSALQAVILPTGGAVHSCTRSQEQTKSKVSIKRYYGANKI